MWFYRWWVKMISEDKGPCFFSGFQKVHFYPQFLQISSFSQFKLKNWICKITPCKSDHIKWPKELQSQFRACKITQNLSDFSITPKVCLAWPCTEKCLKWVHFTCWVSANLVEWNNLMILYYYILGLAVDLLRVCNIKILQKNN